MSDLRTPLRNARGLGSAKDGVNHWIVQRTTAIALVPLVIWFVASMVAYAGADYDTMIAYLKTPLVSILMALFVIAAFHHMRLGLQVVIEDYIVKEGTRVALLLLISFAVYGTGAAAIFSILKISLS